MAPGHDVVSVFDVLTMCGALVDDAVRTRLDRTGPILVPVLLEEIERWTPLLGAVIEAAEGALIDAASAGNGVRTGDDVRMSLPELVSEVDNALKSLAVHDPGSYGDLRIETTATTAVVTGPLSISSANRAQRTVREFLSALFDIDLRRATLAALVWDDSPLDADSSAILFQLVQSLPDLLQMNEASSLIAIIGNGNLRIGDHCRGPRGLRHRVSAAGSLQQREAHSTARQRILELARLSRDDAPLKVLMLGAGTSVNAGLPDGNTLRNRALTRRLGYRVDESNIRDAGTEFFEALRAARRLLIKEEADGAEHFAAALTLERVLREEQHEENQRLSATLRWFREEHTLAFSRLPSRFPAATDPLRRILARQREVVLVEVNFDQVIEGRAAGLVRTFISEADCDSFADYLADYAANGGPVPLLKLHGDIGVADTIVANTDETAGGLSQSRLRALRTLRNTLGPVSPWWYVGYSMRDLDLNPLLASPDFADGLVERWIAPMLSPSIRLFLRQSRLERWQGQRLKYTVEERQISLTAEEFWEMLSEEFARLPT